MPTVGTRRTPSPKRTPARPAARPSIGQHDVVTRADITWTGFSSGQGAPSGWRAAAGARLAATNTPAAFIAVARGETRKFRKTQVHSRRQYGTALGAMKHHTGIE